MILSNKKSFIFIHNPKAAGRTVKNIFNDYGVYQPFKINALNKIAEALFLKDLTFKNRNNSILRGALPRRICLDGHSTAATVRKALGAETWRKYFTFGFVRNPWDREVSTYFFIKQNSEHVDHQLVKKMKDFREYLYWSLENENRFQKDYFYDEKGKKIVDYIGKVERIGIDLAYVQNKLGIPTTSPSLKNKSDHADYRTYYDSESEDLVRHFYCRDIKEFGYEFD